MADAKEEPFTDVQMDVIHMLYRRIPTETPVVWVYGKPETRRLRAQLAMWFVHRKLGRIIRPSDTIRDKVTGLGNVVIIYNPSEEPDLGVKLLCPKHVLVLADFPTKRADVVLICSDS